MSYFKQELKAAYEEQHIEWEITDFYSKSARLLETQVESSSPVFFFGEIPWEIHFSRYHGHDFWHVSVTCDEYTDEMESDNVEAVLALKRVDGTLNESLLVHDGEKYDGYYYIYNVADSELLEKKNDLTTSDSLTFVCIIRSGASYYPQPASNECPPPKVIALDALSDNFKNLTSRGSFDVTLQVQNKAFKVHKTVLVARSPVFADIFQQEMEKKPLDMIHIEDCDPKYFPEFLEYIYCGKLENPSFPGVLHLYNVSKRYAVQELKLFCIDYMARNLADDNVCDVIVLAEKNNEAKLLSLARKFFYKNGYKIVHTSKWKEMWMDNSDVVTKLVMDMGSKI